MFLGCTPLDTHAPWYVYPEGLIGHHLQNTQHKD